MTDKRKRRWIVLDIQYPRGHSTQALIRKLDSTAPGVWVALLTAAKREQEQGTLTYWDDDDAWRLLGLNPNDFKYTFTDFLTATGHLKMTRKTTRTHRQKTDKRPTKDRQKTAQTPQKHLQKVVITKWEEWQGSARTGAGRARKANNYGDIPDYETRRNRAITAPPQPEMRPISAPVSAPNRPPEIESEIESEIERDSTTKKNQEPVDNPLADITDLIGNITKPLTAPTPRTKEEQLRYLKGLTE